MPILLTEKAVDFFDYGLPVINIKKREQGDCRVWQCHVT